MAPQFIERQAFAIQAGGARGRSPGLMQAAFAADAMLTADRNRGLDSSLHLPRGQVVGYEDRAALDTGGLLPEGPIAVWHDYRTVHAERLTFAVARAAAEAGAVLANYMDAVELLREGDSVIGAVVRDAVDAERWQIESRVVINATGAAAGRLMAAMGVRPTPPLVKALNLVTRRPAPAVACGAPTADGRLLFALPWQGKLSIGTWHGLQPCGADAHLVTPDELDAFSRPDRRGISRPAADAQRRDAGSARRSARDHEARTARAGGPAHHPRASPGRRQRRRHADGREVHDGTRRRGVRGHAGDGADWDH
jgi:glycerol-3-phosphate dehydrogenase